MMSRKALNLLVLVSMLASLMMVSGVSPASAQKPQEPQAASNNVATPPQSSPAAASKIASSMPISPTDESKVPHYFGPYPNYANSAFTLPDATVTISGTGGQGATAEATVGGNGAITAINITNPGRGYTSASVSITGAGVGASAIATVTTSGAVTAITVDAAGLNYLNPKVIIAGTATTTATATAYGGVYTVTLLTPGSGYTMPTVDFDMPDDPNGLQAKAHVTMDANGAITGIIIDNPGAGYASAPNIVIRDGTPYSPLNNRSKAALAARQQAIDAKKAGPVAPVGISAVSASATATTTLFIQRVGVDNFGAGYTSDPSVSIVDSNGGSGTGAMATAHTDAGAVTAIGITNPGSGYVTQGGIKKFQDGLPQLCILQPGQTFNDCASNNLGQHIPVAVPDTTTFTTANGHGPDADFYVIALVQHRERMSSSLPDSGTLLRDYVQIETPVNASFSKHVPLVNELRDGTTVPATINGVQAYAVDDPHFMGPIIAATKDKPVRILFYNLLPTGSAGDLFIPVDTTFMGSGMGPMDMAMGPMDQGSVLDGVRNPVCGDPTKNRADCFADTRASIHLHGGITPWISDGSPHQWITPANEQTGWPQGVAVTEVPDMVGGKQPAGIPDCTAGNDGCTTFYYTNQQSARLMFYHDHAWGITRLNVYAGEAAGYLITDPTEQKLINTGTIPTDQVPLVIQDRTFVPSKAQMAEQDPTWDYSRWGSEGDLWYEHVYMPAQNPGDPSGISAYGRWMYGPWFWPPATPKYGPIDNPYYDPNCKLDDSSTWQYQVDPYCEPQQIPGTPNNSAGMEQFNDTPIVNGTAYPTMTVQPKSYRFRILNAANDRFWNLQWYVADPTTGTDSEVALKASELAAAQTDPNIFPTPDTNISPAGPSWIQIGTEGGFLPAPVVVPNQPITFITDPTRFDVGNVDQHSLLLGPAERADVIVDFSKFAGKTLILYNDAPAAFPARVASYDYYTGGPDMRPIGAPTILPGYGPNTRTIMQIKVAAASPAPAFDLAKLNKAFSHKADLSGVFESGQHPIIVGQAAYNSAYGTSFISGGWCTSPTNPTSNCDGYARISEQGGDNFKFDTLRGTQIGVKIEPKALHDEQNATDFEEFGRMSGNLGVEAVPATPALQNVVLYPFVNPPTEMFDATNLPTSDTVTPIAVGNDGTEIWKFTHNGVDTHPIHFHLYDVQVLNRVTWDNIIIPPDPTELGWKDTVRVSPLEDTIFAIRPIIPKLPFEIPNSIRPLNPMMPIGDTSMFNNVDPNGNPTTTNITNQLVNFGWEYMLHCHILSHEEMDMMRPVMVAMPPNKPTGLAVTFANNRATFTWNDNSINETGFAIQQLQSPNNWVTVGTVDSPLGQPNIHQARTLTINGLRSTAAYQFRVVAQDTIGYGGDFPSMTAVSMSDPVVGGTPPVAPANLTALLQTGPQVRLTWTDNATTETFFVIERATNGGAFTQVGTAPARNGTGSVSWTDTTVAANSTVTTYTYRVAAWNPAGQSAYATLATGVSLPILPPAPMLMSATAGTCPNGRAGVVVQWMISSTTNVTGFTLERGTMSNGVISWATTTPTYPSGATSGCDSAGRRGRTYYYRVLANNGTIIFNPSNVSSPVVAP